MRLFFSSMQFLLLTTSLGGQFNEVSNAISLSQSSTITTPMQAQVDKMHPDFANAKTPEQEEVNRDNFPALHKLCEDKSKPGV